MTKEQYEKWSAPYRKSKNRMRILTGADKIVTLLVFIFYPVLLGYLFYINEMRELYKCLLIPSVSFLGVSLFRKIYSAPRPYEVLDIKPLIHKNTEGKSFPSRHVFSVFIIGMTYFYMNPGMGMAVFGVGILMGYVRVAGGVHFPKDVIAGMGMGILCGCMYWVIE